VYNASSPDELALVNMAKVCGYRFIGTDDDNYMTIRIYEDPLSPQSKYKELKYKLLNVLEFSSARKRQSVIL
jgi:phospholipid-transporting ATPase